MGGNVGNESQILTPQVTAASSVASAKPLPANFDPKHPTGDPLTDNGELGSCKDAPRSTECFLDKDQRKGVVDVFQARVGLVHTNCANALLEIKIEEKLKKTDDIPWYASLILSAIAAALTEGLSVGIGAGLAAGGRALAGTGRAASGAITGLSGDVQKMFWAVVPAPPAPSLDNTRLVIASKAVDAGSNAAKPALGGRFSADSDEEKEKQARLSFIQYMQTTLDERFATLLDVPPATMSDRELIALRDAFNLHGGRHSQQSYVARFKAMLDQFTNSPLSKMGRRTGWDHKRNNGHFELETRVAWLITRGAGKRLVYVDRAFSDWYQQARQHEQLTDASRTRAYDSGKNQLSLQQEGDWHTAFGDERRRETPVGPDMMLGYVESEFVERALELQKEIWLAEPETFMLDYSYAPPKLVKVAST